MDQPSGEPPQPTGSLKQFDILIGQWEMVGTHPGFPAPVQGQSTFEWLVEGALLIWRFNWEPGGPPNAISVIGHDDAGKACTMLYSDERGVARIYQMSLEIGVWKMWRDSPGFLQRVTAMFSADGTTITGHGERSRDGTTWEQDLDVTYTRKR